MDLLKYKKYEPIYVIGHSNIDIDSAVSSKILCDLFNDFGVKAYYAVLDKKYRFFMTVFITVLCFITVVLLQK